MEQTKQYTKAKSYISKATGAKVTVYGEPNIDVWAKKLMQVNEDIKAGKYKKEESC
ncbi:hypothetical protein [Priestia megaterium]|uniref:hypothetical protein n=1 Tax=Priestia megaterium TaxID=1404 RepID=UPI0014835E15|nr:hypothetical protein [Priestia megaterium]